MAAETRASTTPYKRSRIDSSTFGQDNLFAPLETSAQSKKTTHDQPTQDFVLENL